MTKSKDEKRSGAKPPEPGIAGSEARSRGRARTEAHEDVSDEKREKLAAFNHIAELLTVEHVTSQGRERSLRSAMDAREKVDEALTALADEQRAITDTIDLACSYVEAQISSLREDEKTEGLRKWPSTVRVESMGRVIHDCREYQRYCDLASKDALRETLRDARPLDGDVLYRIETWVLRSLVMRDVIRHLVQLRKVHFRVRR